MEATQEIIRPKLLLADDSITIRKVVELTFAEEGIDVFAVGDGEAAMARFVEVQPDIVLVDVNMPEPTGYHICEMIKQDESTKNIPVLLLVGSFEPFDTSEAERVGADGFLTKPFQSVRELIRKVTELLGRDNGAPSSPAETADIDNLYENSFAETYRSSDGTAVDTLLGDTGMDDDLIETSYRDGAQAAVSPVSEQAVAGYDWMAEPAVPEFRPEPEPSEAAVERVVDEFADTLEVEEPAVQEIEEPSAASGIDEHARSADQPEMSEATIDEIVRRVVEKMSDKAVRDVAREAVPRIAEKLIREALDQDKKQ